MRKCDGGIGVDGSVDGAAVAEERVFVARTHVLQWFSLPPGGKKHKQRDTLWD